MSVRSYLNDRVTLHCGDCREVLATLPEASIDAIVCDPPYALTQASRNGSPRNNDPATPFGRTKLGERTERGFMGKTWDTGETAFDPEFWVLALRALKPGGALVAFSGTRTYHRMACAIEDAGFEIRDQLAWAYGSGMNKVGYIREENGEHVIPGWGGSLKPAWEPICLARNPLIGSLRANMQQHGTGAFNIDECRIEASARPLRELDAKPTDSNVYAGRTGEGGLGNGFDGGSKAVGTTDLGRWPANLLHDGSDEVLACFPDSPGQQGDVKGTEPSRTGDENTVAYGKFNGRVPAKARRDGEESANRRYTAEGGTNFAALPGERRSDGASAARFFYASKADADDRIGSKHPTIKPVDLMQWLVRLVTPKGGVVLDPFAGTGTTGEAAWREGMRAILIEREPEYQDDIARRMDLVLKPTKRAAVAKTKNKLDDPNALPLFGGTP